MDTVSERLVQWLTNGRFKALVQWLKNLYSVQTCRNCVFQISMFILKYSDCPVQCLTSRNRGSSLVTVVVGLNISG